MKGSVTKDYSAYKISTGSGSQDLALVFGEGVDDEKYVDFKVTWVQYASVKVIKRDAKADAKLAGAVFGLYSDANCTNLITKLPATDANGEASVQIIKTQNTVYLKEITAPTGYRINATAYNVKLEVSKTTTVTVPDEEQMGQLTVYKEGQVLTGADVTENGTTFKYEKRRQKGAIYDVYAGADIKTAYGAKVYSKGDLVKENLTTDSNGAVILKNLHLGTYIVKEKQAPTGFYNAGEEKSVTLSYAGQNVDVVFSETKGDVILKANTVIEEQATDKEGKLTFTADLPLGYTYYVKETSPAPGFATTDQVQEFTFEYGGADKETLSYVFTFEDEPTTVEFTKTSLTDGKEIEGAKLKVTDESGNTVDEWTSGKEPHIIKELTAGKKYTMTETLPADGYVTAESITFTVEDTGEVQKVEMKDDVTKVQISKTDISGKELPGAKLTILDKDGKTVESWTSEKKPHYIEMLPIGEYILREETAPDGYLVAEDVKFTVKDTGEIQKVVMKDEAKPEETPTETPTETPETTPTPETKTTEETKKSTSPKTGDNTPILFWILLAGAGMAGLGGTVILRKKKK